MRRVLLSLALCSSLGSASVAEAAPRAPRPGEIKPYVPPVLPPEPEPVPSDVVVVQTPEDQELVLPVRPAAGMPMLGSVRPGARLPVRGEWEAPTTRGCATRKWYAIEPAGWVCSAAVRRASGAASTDPVLKVPEGKRLPYQYVMVVAPEGEALPLWASAEDAQAGAPPVFQLRRGDTVALRDGAPPLKVDGAPHHVADDGRVLPARSTTRMSEGSEWEGVVLEPGAALPFGWITPATAPVFDGPDPRARAGAEKLPRRTRVEILEEAGLGRNRRLRIGEGRWVRASDVNEVRALPRPPGVIGGDRWIDVDLGEQVLVAYEGERPVFATLVSSGRALPTPRGNYPIWAKVAQITMKSQAYEDDTYYVDRVPWVLFFQAHNAIHGAYWHDRFGMTKSHGCVNVAPKDARWLFEWVPPALPVAWTGLRTPDLTTGVTVHVRDSAQRRPFVQERPMGPPDRELEAQKLAEAEARRAAAAVTTTGGTADPGPPGGGGLAPAGPAPAAPGPSAAP